MALWKYENENTYGLDITWQSRGLFADIMYYFREFHDLCVGSNLFSDDLILEIDQCAVDFRQVTLNSATVAQRVSIQWLRSAIVLFENIDHVSNPSAMLILLGKQAKDLARCFTVHAAWARDLAGRFHRAQDGSIKETEALKERFQAALDRAKDVKRQTGEALERAIRNREQILQWNPTVIGLAWNPIGLLLGGIGSAVVGKEKLEEAGVMERHAEANYKRAKADLQIAADQREKAEFLAGKVAQLLEVLGKLEEASEAIAVFWSIESDKFDAHGSKLETDSSALIELIGNMAIKEDLKTWKIAKLQMENYADAMSVIGNTFNFVTGATPSTTQSVTLENLDITLPVPTSVDIKGLMN
jgi:hypothetical protein